MKVSYIALGGGVGAKKCCHKCLLPDKNSVDSLIIKDFYLLLVLLLISERVAKTRSVSHTTNPPFPRTDEEIRALL